MVSDEILDEVSLACLLSRAKLSGVLSDGVVVLAHRARHASMLWLTARLVEHGG